MLLSRIYFLVLLLCLSNTLASEISYVSIAVSNIDMAAKYLSSKGFVLKKPHYYKTGHQKGLIAQSVRFFDGSYIQLIAIKKTQGALSKWYEKELSNHKALGVSLTLKSKNLSKLSENLKSQGLDNMKINFNRYDYLSFKTHSPYSHLSFIDVKQPIKQDNDLFAHRNKAKSLSRVKLNITNNLDNWAKILSAAKAQNSNLDFNGSTYNARGFFNSLTLNSSASKCPESFQYGNITFDFNCE